MPEVFVGRVDEQAVAADLLHRARVGRPLPLLIRGDPGIGKSTLLERLATDAERSGFRRVVVDAERVDSGVPFAALRLALDEALGEETDPSLVDVSAALRGALRRPSPSQDDARQLLHRVIEGWAFRGPVLLAIDDLHHADAHTATAVLHLMRMVRAQRVLIIATTRPVPFLAGDAAAAIESLQRGELARVLDLGALDEGEIAELIRHRTDLEPSTRLVHLLHERAGGTPFYVIELLDAMTRSGDLLVDGHRADAAESDALALPRRLSTAVLHRVFGLGPDARLVATAAAVLGRVPAGGVGLLAAVSGLDERRTRNAFERLTDAGVFAPDGADHLFTHAIVRDAVYDDIGPAARRRLHGRAARAMADEGWGRTNVLEVAGHVLRSTGGHDGVAARTLIAAGDSVADVAPRAAIGWYRAAIARLHPRDQAVVPVQLSLARVLDLSGAHAEGARVAEAALGHASTAAERRRAVGRAARSLANAGQRERAIALLDDALADPESRTATLLLHQAESLLWTDRQHEVLALVAEARAHGSERVRPVADAVAMHAAVGRGDFRAGLRLFDLLRVELDTTTVATRLTTRIAICAVGAFNFDPGVAIRIADGVEATEPMAPWLAAIAAWAHYRQGRFADVGAAAARARADGELGDGQQATGLWLAAGIASGVERGDPDVAELIAHAEATQRIPVFETGVDVARAMWHRQRREHDAAATLLAAAVDRERGRGQCNVLATALGAAVDAAVDRGDTAAVHRLHDELEELADEASVATTMSCLLARAVAADDLDAAHAARDHAVRFGLAGDAGRALGLVGRFARDADVLADAYRELGELGAVWRQRTVAHDLRRLGRRVPHGPSSSTDLSPVEVEVVSLVTDGLTNRKIAERMGLSPKTVEVYLSRIYSKTGHRARVELAVAAREGLLEPT